VIDGDEIENNFDAKIFRFEIVNEVGTCFLISIARFTNKIEIISSPIVEVGWKGGGIVHF